MILIDSIRRRHHIFTVVQKGWKFAHNHADRALLNICRFVAFGFFLLKVSGTLELFGLTAGAGLEIFVGAGDIVCRRADLKWIVQFGGNHGIGRFVVLFTFTV